MRPTATWSAWEVERFWEVAYRESMRYDPCAFCGRRPRDFDKARPRNGRLRNTLDHIVPRSRLCRNRNLYHDNLTAACRECNEGKGNEDLLCFLLTLQT